MTSNITNNLLPVPIRLCSFHAQQSLSGLWWGVLRVQVKGSRGTILTIRFGEGVVREQGLLGVLGVLGEQGGWRQSCNKNSKVARVVR